MHETETSLQPPTPIPTKMMRRVIHTGDGELLHRCRFQVKPRERTAVSRMRSAILRARIEGLRSKTQLLRRCPPEALDAGRREKARTTKMRL